MSYARIPEAELGPFKQWLISQDYILEHTHGDYEVLRWKTVKEGNPKPILFRNDKGNGMLTINKEAHAYYRDWKDGFE